MKLKDILNEAVGKTMIGLKVVTSDEVLSYMFANPAKPLSKAPNYGPPTWKQTNAFDGTFIKHDNLETAISALEQKYGKGNIVVTGNTRGGDPVVQIYSKK